jgi:hypothetical protein
VGCHDRDEPRPDLGDVETGIMPVGPVPDIVLTAIYPVTVVLEVNLLIWAFLSKVRLYPFATSFKVLVAGSIQDLCEDLRRFVFLVKAKETVAESQKLEQFHRNG